MKKAIKITAIVIGLCVIVMQFIHPAKNTSAAVSTKDITSIFPVPDTIKQILSTACYDCHSDNTRYPWYSKIQPVDWWLNDHITEGKQHLNFSEFGAYTLLKQAKKLKKSAKEVEEEDMPLSSYTWIHKDAILNNEEKRLFIAWASSLSNELFARVSPEEIAADSIQHALKKKRK